MRKTLVMVIMLGVLSGGCNSLRFAPSETQKQNAWLHNRTAAAAADVARSQNSSQKLQQLTSLCAVQSRAFVSYYGTPSKFPPADTAEDILAQSSWQLAAGANSQAAERPDAWQAAEGALELAIGVAALFGGVYAGRIGRFLKEARNKSKALREIIQGNELFKRQHNEVSSAFKEAHKDQSPQTRQIVTQYRSS